MTCWRPRALATRLPLVMMAAQGAFIVAALILFPLFAPFMSYATVADETVRQLITASIVRDEDGTVAIVPTATLIAYQGIRPGLVYGAALTGLPPIAGSSPAMAGVLTRLGPMVPKVESNFEIARPNNAGQTIFITTKQTTLGLVTFATAGNVFRADDIPSFIDVFMPAIVPAYGPVMFGALIVLPIVLRRMLRPLRAVAREAASIDTRSLDRRLPEHGLPSELFPVVHEINAALDRLAEGWARQRLFTANAAHELRTPVAVLQARIDSMPHDSPDRGALARDVRRLKLLIDQLLSIARLDHRDRALDRSVDLVTCVRGLVADCAPLAIRAGRRISFRPLVNVAELIGDRQSIEGAVANLIDNAIRAEPEGGTVEVLVGRTMAEHDDTVFVAVCDHGHGVATADRTLVFEPFWRKDEHSPGTGLGLAAVREVARRHNARASVSETEGGGATFRIDFTASRISSPVQ